MIPGLGLAPASPMPLIAALLHGLVALPQGPSQTIDFGRDIRPMLADRCFACHGPDAGSRKAELRLDTREGATKDLGGRWAIVPGDAKASELWQRITTEDDGERMPPASAHKQGFDAGELERLEAWINAGATWGQHWAFVKPRRPDLPPDAEGHPVDVLLRRRLEAEGMTMSQRAPVHTLARRLAMDLSGIPATPDQVAALGEAPTEAQWREYVDGLLASSHHAERLAMWWLDGARYADTDGFQQDATRTNWPWRDWVVDAFADNMPFDRFTELQFAGDLIENATPEQILATCFHRNHMHNGEGGRDPEESRIDYVRDRTNTIGTVWLGLTLECAQCHDHKFDPVSQSDYYALSAFFNSIDESGQAGGGAKPFLSYRSLRATETVTLAEGEARAAREHRQRLESARTGRFDSWLDELCESGIPGTSGWRTPVLERAYSEVGSALSCDDDARVTRSGPAIDKDEYVLRLRARDLPRITGLELTVFADAQDRFSDAADGEFILTGVKLSVENSDGGPRRHGQWRSAATNANGKGVDREVSGVRGALNDDPRNGWTARGARPEGNPRAVFALDEPLPLSPDDVIQVVLLFRSTQDGAYARQVGLRLTSEGGDAVRSLETTPLDALTAAVQAGQGPQQLAKPLRKKLFGQFLEGDSEWRAADHRARRLDAQLRQARAAAKDLRVTVLAERAKPRQTFVLERGEWDKHGDEVTPAILGAIGPGTSGPLDRRALARWLVHEDNPLTARTVVNQIWQMLMGQGLVRTPGDLGAQGEAPVHQEILDWLATDFVQNGWNVRHLIRTIVASETYRQSSVVDPAARTRDPDNRWLARAHRFRLPSWMLRDRALAVSGLLDRRRGGPPVFPHQPKGVWEEMFMGRMRYQPTVGKGRHRRSLYAFWRRNVSPTFFFDNADRRTCSVDRRLTNTPLHALTLLNDRTFVEAAQGLAALVQDEPGTATEAIEAMIRRVLLRAPNDRELSALVRIYDRALQAYNDNATLATTATEPSSWDAVPVSRPQDPATRAALTAVAIVLFNLDEAVTRE